MGRALLHCKLLNMSATKELAKNYYSGVFCFVSSVGSQAVRDLREKLEDM